GGGTPSRPGTDAPFWAEPSARGAPAGPRPNDPLAPGNPAAQLDGVLAGRLVDAFGRRPRDAFIQVALVDAGGGPASKPIGVQADADGYFVIQGLQPGKTYQLTARAEEAGQVIAGAAQARPPYTRLLIRLTEDGVSSLTAPPPPHPGSVGPWGDKGKTPEKGAKPSEEENAGPPPAAIPNREPPEPDPVPGPEGGPPGRDPLYGEGDGDQAWAPGPRGLPTPAARDFDRGAPAPPRPAPLVPYRPENIAEGAAPPRPPAVSIPGPGSAPPPPAAPPPARGPDSGPHESPYPPLPTPIGGSSDQFPQGSVGRPGAARAEPRAGRNFVLYDPQGQPWEFRDHSGELVLLDFWGTWCLPCLQALPEMRRLAARYGAAGLEVIGIAVENDPWPQAAAKVESVRQRANLNYRVYLEGEKTRGVVQRMFGVRQLPTLVLLDADGTVLWTGTPSRLHELEAILRERLGR
ncbi:MAG TPA: redoxin domain-containing protein, partial [Gemmataceae bacterium]